MSKSCPKSDSVALDPAGTGLLAGVVSRTSSNTRESLRRREDGGGVLVPLNDDGAAILQVEDGLQWRALLECRIREDVVEEEARWNRMYSTAVPFLFTSSTCSLPFCLPAQIKEVVRLSTGERSVWHKCCCFRRMVMLTSGFAGRKALDASEDGGFDQVLLHASL